MNMQSVFMFQMLRSMVKLLVEEPCLIAQSAEVAALLLMAMEKLEDDDTAFDDGDGGLFNQGEW